MPVIPDKHKKAVSSRIDLNGLKKGVKERERELVQEQLIQTNKLATIGMLAGSVAHQLNNPVCGIMGFAQLLRSALKDNPENQKDAGQIEELAVRCRDIISNLIAFVRPENAAAGPVDINEAITKTFILAEHRLKVSGITIEKKAAGKLPMVNGSLVQLQQVFLNIILNAVSAMDKQGKLTVESGMKGNNVFVKISDTGCGIPEDVLPNIFDPFFSTKPAGDGAGLGLALCRSIVTMNGGNIEVESAVGAGTSFTVSFPALKGTRGL